MSIKVPITIRLMAIMVAKIAANAINLEITDLIKNLFY